MVAPLPPANKNWIQPDGKPTLEFSQWAFGVPLTAGFVAPTPTRAGDIIYWNGSAWVTLAGNNSGTQFLQENSSGVPSWGTIAAPAGTLVSIVVYSGTQTITIPAGATKAFVRMWGGTGGTGNVNSNASAGAPGGTGAAGYLEKLLTGLTPALTLAYTQGAAGAGGAAAAATNAGGNGSASTLASGTQTITTLTANGSNGSAGTNGTSSAGTAGGTATNGDYNQTGTPGGDGFYLAFSDGNLVGQIVGVPGVNGSNVFSFGARKANMNTGAGASGQSGGLIIMWFA